MAKSSKEIIAEKRQRKEEYKKMRQTLIDIIESEKTTNAEKIAAIDVIFKIDAEGIPMPKDW
jgi:hypothetical protein